MILRDLNPVVRPGTLQDVAQLAQLYRAVAAIPDRLARAPDEITRDHVETFVRAAIARGVLFVAERGVGEVVGEVHASRPEPRCFEHVLGELTIAVHPRVQGMGIGRALLEALLQRSLELEPPVERIELFVREDNVRARRLYESFGFRAEGRMPARILTGQQLAADIPMGWTRQAAEAQVYRQA